MLETLGGMDGMDGFGGFGGLGGMGGKGSSNVCHATRCPIKATPPRNAWLYMDPLKIPIKGTFIMSKDLFH